MTFVYFTPEQARACVPEGTKRLCLVASYRGEAGVCPNLVKYICNIAPQFDRVVMLTNSREGLKDVEGLPDCCAVVKVPNMLLDFGMWSRLLHVLDGGGLERLCLVNDSCLIVKDMTPCFLKAEKRGWQFWGMVASGEVAPHVQSFFLVGEGERAVGAMLDFFKGKDMARYVGIEKMELVKEFEVGLSRHMAGKGFALDAVFYPHLTLYVRTVLQQKFEYRLSNVSYGHADALLVMGCPLVKKARLPLQQMDKLIKIFGDPEFV